jgi:uncharacterized protein YqfA (UPF0365 family)
MFNFILLQTQQQLDINIGLIVAIAFGAIFCLWLLFYFIPVGLWFNAWVSGAPVPLLQLILMRWRKVPPEIIVRH